MTTETQTAEKCASTEVGSRPNTALDWAIYGCLAAGGVGILKALDMDRPFDVLICLLGSVIAFSVVLYVHLRKR